MIRLRRAVPYGLIALLTFWCASTALGQAEPTLKDLAEKLTVAEGKLEAAESTLASNKTDAKVAMDTLWVMIAAFLVFFMNLGFACVESGFCRAKNCVNILSKNFIVFAATTIGFWFVGWGLMFGNGNDWVGTQGALMVSGPDGSPATGSLADKIKGDIKTKYELDLGDEKIKDDAKYAALQNAITAIYQNPPIKELDKKDGKGNVIKNDKGEAEQEKKIVVSLDVPGKGKFEQNYGLSDAYWGSYSALNWTGVPMWAKFFFQLVFAGTAATIVSGAVAERIKYHSFIIFSFVMAIAIYPVVGHWIWGGGTLQAKGFMDFAGSTQVHSIGGWAALIAVILLGPRIGKYGPDGRVNAIPGHNLTAATIGCFILWFGWFGFNPGSTMGVDANAIAEVALTTNLAACAATLSATVVAWLLLGKPDLGMTLNGCLAGLVAITAPCAFVGAGVAILIGLIAGTLVVLAVLMFDRLKLDDPVGATSVHLVNGVFGTICVGLFATPDRIGRAGNAAAKPGLFAGGGMDQLLVQLQGVAYTAVYVMALSAVAWIVIKAVVGMRVSEEEELEGLDIGEHGNEAYHGFVIEKVGEVAQGVGAEPKAAKMPPGGKRYSVVVDGATSSELLAAWSDMCQPGRAPDPSAFKGVYPFMTTVTGNKFNFRGGDPEAVKTNLQKLFNGSLTKSVSLTVQ